MWAETSRDLTLSSYIHFTITTNGVVDGGDGGDDGGDHRMEEREHETWDGFVVGYESATLPNGQ